MRDAFGSTFMFRLIIIFIVFYVTFATIAVSYAKTFRLKNEVVNIIEQYQLYPSDYSNDNGFLNTSAIKKVDEYLKSSNYNHYNDVRNSCSGNSKKLTRQGACVEAIKYDRDKYYYRVTLYMVIDFPVLTFSPVIPVSGDTVDYVGSVRR